MIGAMKKAIKAVLRQTGYDIVPGRSVQQDSFYPPDFDEATAAMCRSVEPFTMTSKERLFALRRSVEYVIRNDIPGDIVECGVWRGGSMMAVAQTLMDHGIERTLYLFDTFNGMSEPVDKDRNFRGKTAAECLATEDKNTSWTWAYCSLTDVRKNLLSTRYDEQRIVFVEGKVEDTIPSKAPERIALLRLDTDWYESTYHELVHLYPRLSVGGVLIIDDYGHWEGARRAVDEYVEKKRLKLLLNRIDYTGRVCIKLEP
jgi:O-methyltransferase